MANPPPIPNQLRRFTAPWPKHAIDKEAHRILTNRQRRFKQLPAISFAEWHGIPEDPEMWQKFQKAITRYYRSLYPDTSTDRFFQQFTTTVKNAPKGMRDPAFINSETMLRYHDRADWSGVHNAMKVFAAALVEQCRQKGIPMYVHTAYRTPQEQLTLYKAGRSKIRLKGPHTVGCAADIVHGIHHWDLQKEEWQWIGATGKQIANRLGIEVTWGGDWGFFDPAHWQLNGWQEHQPIGRNIDHKGDPIHIRYTPRKILREFGKEFT